MSYLKNLNQVLTALCGLFVSFNLQAAGDSNGQGGGGGMGSGGGTSCGATIRSGAEQVALWMDANGPGMKKGCAMSGAEFRKLIPVEKDLQYLSSAEDLTYLNNPEIAMFLQKDLKTIKVRCDRVDLAFGKNPVGFNKNVAHEIFRKTKHEGDEFECSKQVFSPKEVAADLDYALDKKITVMRFADDPSALVKISVSKDNTELFGFRECPTSAISEDTGGSQYNVDIAFEKCTVIGANFYRAKDLAALEESMNNRVLSVLSTSDFESKATLALGIGLFSNGALVYATDASAVPGFKQLGRAYNQVFLRLFPQTANFRSMMQAKAAVAAISVALGTTLAYRAITLKQRANERMSEDLKAQNIQLKSGSGYASFGLYLVMNFEGSKLSSKSIKNLIVDTITQLEKEKLIKSVGKF